MSVAPKPLWFDDFFGVAIDPRYKSSIVGAATVGVSAGTSQNGILLLNAPSSQQSVCRTRLGEDPGQGLDVRNWNAVQSIVYEARCFLNTKTYTQNSIGFVGANDPQNFLTMYYYTNSSSQSTWKLSFAYNNVSHFVDTGFTHTPGTWFTFRLVTSAGTPYPSTSLFINNDTTTPDKTYSGAEVPQMPLVPEFNCYNFSTGSGYSNSALYVDYVYITQNRQ